jgi:hypothetical protein
VAILIGFRPLKIQVVYNSSLALLKQGFKNGSFLENVDSALDCL